MSRAALIASLVAVMLAGVVTATAGGDPKRDGKAKGKAEAKGKVEAKGKAQARGKAETLTFTVRLQMAPGHGGPNVGDHHVFAGDLLQQAQDVGDYRGFCIVTVAGPQHLQCNVTADVTGRGDINAVGSVGRAGTGTMSVAGGTGAFAFVRGTRTGMNPRREGGVLLVDLVYRLKHRP